MTEVNEIILYIGILIATIMILVVGMNLLPMADRGPGYVAKKTAFTLDTVAAAPGEVSVEYDISDKDVSMVWFEEPKGRVHVSRYDICNYVKRLLKEGGEASIGMFLDGVWETGVTVRNLFGFAVAEPPITGHQVGGITKYFQNPKDWDDENHYEAVKDQIKTADYKKSHIEYEFDHCADDIEFGEAATQAMISIYFCENPIPIYGDITGLVCDWTNIDKISDCDALVAGFFGDPAYINPEKLIIGKTGDKITVEGVKTKCE
ncbi:hypothetical protein HN924_00410 [Candidatus Woesearchaeota archaeon]|jgi:hypothetical protein|nr:hypothetical protein [Candidatus Woesearchaeota archaeon]MBT7062414.1 hypothetical protein [Candidatus Woesearchaeota archaeon]MBT7402952.1 hypothetical protein [Candidatus Woesearchaeota archaeon]